MTTLEVGDRVRLRRSCFDLGDGFPLGAGLHGRVEAAWRMPGGRATALVRMRDSGYLRDIDPVNLEVQS